MKIIALYGNGSSGKTTTLNIFLKKVLGKYSPNIIATSLCASSLSEYFDDTLNPNGTDHFVVLEIKSKIIGITTVGDNRWCLEKDFKHFGKCELCFCAARSNGKTHEFLKEASNGEVIIQYKQTRIDSHPPISLSKRHIKADESIAELFMEELNSLLQNAPYRFP